MNKIITAASSALALVLATFSIGASADAENKTDAQKQTTITTKMAISIAEKATGGKSTEAEFEVEDGKAIYEVEITLIDGSEVEVEVDAETGAVLSQKTEDDDDQDDREDEKGEHK